MKAKHIVGILTFAVAVTSALSAYAQQQFADPRVADLVRSGTLRVAPSQG
jgi:hypothetical protein